MQSVKIKKKKINLIRRSTLHLMRVRQKQRWLTVNNNNDHIVIIMIEAEL